MGVDGPPCGPHSRRLNPWHQSLTRSYAAPPLASRPSPQPRPSRDDTKKAARPSIYDPKGRTPGSRSGSPPPLFRATPAGVLVMFGGDWWRWTPSPGQESDDSSLPPHQALVILPSRRPWRRGTRRGSRSSPDVCWGGRASRRVRSGRQPSRPPDDQPPYSSHPGGWDRTRDRPANAELHDDLPSQARCAGESVTSESPRAQTGRRGGAGPAGGLLGGKDPAGRFCGARRDSSPDGSFSWAAGRSQLFTFAVDAPHQIVQDVARRHRCQRILPSSQAVRK